MTLVAPRRHAEGGFVAARRARFHDEVDDEDPTSADLLIACRDGRDVPKSESAASRST